MSNKEHIEYVETELPAFLLVNADTFRAVTNIRPHLVQYVTIDNEYRGLILDQDIDEDPIFFADYDTPMLLRQQHTNIMDTPPPHWKILKLSLNAVTRSMQLKYLKMKALQIMVRSADTKILSIQRSLYDDQANVNSNHDPIHHVKIDNTLLVFEMKDVNEHI